jgi:RND family efflux transporter MFP subunit
MRRTVRARTGRILDEVRDRTKPLKPRLVRLAPLLLAAAAACDEAAPDTPEAEIASEVVTQWNDSTELFLEYPHPVAGTQTGNWAIHLTDRKDFQPVRSGTLTVRFTATGGVAQTFTVDAPARDGIFLLDPVVERPGTYQVEFALAGSQVTSRHVLPEVRVHPSRDEAPRAEEEDEGAGIAFLKEQQWTIPFDVVRAEEREVQRTVSVPGEIVPPDAALVQVSAPVAGIAPADRNRGAPSVGERVREGQVLAVLAPTAQEGGFAQSRGRVERLQREVERAERLHAAGAIARRRLEDALRDLDVARAELEALGGVSDGDFHLRLTAPMAGVVARRSFVPGGRVEAGVPLFTLVDPSTAWLRVQVPATRAADLAAGPATFTVEGSDQVHEAGRLLSVGRVMDPRTRTVPVVYEVASPDRLLTFGQIARAAVPVGGGEWGVAIPDAAILDDNGTPVAYVQTGGETFERRVLTLGAGDGRHRHVRAGIRPGEMVVTAGAYQVRLASLSGNEFAGGHAH